MIQSAFDHSEHRINPMILNEKCVERCPPKAEVTSSNLVGCATFSMTWRICSREIQPHIPPNIPLRRLIGRRTMDTFQLSIATKKMHTDLIKQPVMVNGGEL